MLADCGVEKGDRVMIYMPMVPEAVVAMLASARLGAIHSVVFGGFASSELSTRMTAPRRRSSSRPPAASSPRGLVPYKPLLDEAIELAAAQGRHLPRSCSARNARPR